MINTVHFPEKAPDFSGYCSVRTILRYKFIPLSSDGEKIHLAISDQSSFLQKEEIRFLFRGKSLQFSICPEAEIEIALYKWYGVGAEAIHSLSHQKKTEQFQEKALNDSDKETKSEEKRVSQIVDGMIRDAVRLNASDIHLEPYLSSFKIRYRIDGVLTEAKISSDVFILSASLISRVKILAKMDLAEKRLPQDSRISDVRFGGESIDLRVSVLPTIHGESAVIRILRKKQSLLLHELGFDANDEMRIKNFMQRPQGLFLVSGPTGSGKTTTLYAMIQTMNILERKTMTVEDPVEYQIDGVIQSQVNHKINWTFSNALRAMLRQDPDCFMIGEIRDQETAEIAVQAALTGHLVLATIHTKDAPSAISRLLDMGIEPHLLADAIDGVLAQRLARRICLQCQNNRSLKPQCEPCRGSGYCGRIMIYELMEMNDEIRGLINQRAPVFIMREKTLAKTMRSLKVNAEDKIQKGLISLEEAKRIL